MSWVSIVLFVMQHIPDLIGIIQSIIKLIHGLPLSERVAAREKIAQAIQTGTHNDVRRVTAEVHGRCEGMVGVPMDLVKE